MLETVPFLGISKTAAPPAAQIKLALEPGQPIPLKIPACSVPFDTLDEETRLLREILTATWWTYSAGLYRCVARFSERLEAPKQLPQRGPMVAAEPAVRLSRQTNPASSVSVMNLVLNRKPPATNAGQSRCRYSILHRIDYSGFNKYCQCFATDEIGFILVISPAFSEFGASLLLVGEWLLFLIWRL